MVAEGSAFSPGHGDHAGRLAWPSTDEQVRRASLDGGLAAVVSDGAAGVRELPLEGAGDGERVSQVPVTPRLTKFAHQYEKISLLRGELGFDVGFDTPTGSESFAIMEGDTGGAGGVARAGLKGQNGLMPVSAAGH